MGPREALEQIRALIGDALTADDVDAIRRSLQRMNEITEQAIGRGTLRSNRLIRERIDA